MQLLPKVLEDYQKNQQRMLEGGKSEEVAARAAALENRLRGQQQDTARLGAEKINTQRIAELSKLYQNASAAGDKLQMQALQNELKLILQGGVDNAKAAEILTKNAQNPLTASNVQSPDMLQKGIDLTGRLAMEKGIPGIIGKMLGEKSQQVVDLGKMVSRPDGSMIPVPNPQMKSGPSLGAKMLEGGTSIPSMIDMLRNKAGENRQQFMPGSIPSQPQQPVVPPTSQPQAQGIQPGGQALQPQAQVAQPRMNANPLAYTPPNQSIPEKQSKTFQSKGLVTPAGPGDKYEIGVFIDPQTAENERKYGMKAIPGKGTSDERKEYQTDAKFVGIGNALNDSIAEGFNTRSKSPGQTAMHRIFGSPTNQPGVSGAWNKAVNTLNPWSDAPNREGAISSFRKNIEGLAGSNKNTEQAASILQANLNQLVGRFDDDEGTKKVFNDINMNLSKLLSSYTKSVTGSQVNEKELELFSIVVPDLFKSPETAASMILNLTTRAGMINALRASKYHEDVIFQLMNNPNVVNDIKNYTRAYAEDLVSQIPNISNRPGVKAKGAIDKNRLNPVNILGSIAEKYPDEFKGVVIRPRANNKSTINSVPSTTRPQKIDDDAVARYKKAMGIN